MPDINARLQKLQSDAEILRFIHNYVASAKTLIDHSRRLKNKFLNKVDQKEYNERVKTRFEEPRKRLLIDLRNYLLHFDLPGILHLVNCIEGSSRLALLPEKLLEWDKWSQGVKSYLKANIDEKLLIEDIVSEYWKAALDFGEWILNSIIKLFETELTNIYAISNEILKSVQENKLICDPLIVRFFKAEYRLINSLTNE